MRRPSLRARGRGTLLTALACLLALLACGTPDAVDPADAGVADTGPSDGPALVIEGVSLGSASPTIAVGLSHTFIATGTYGDGTTVDLTSQVTWASSDLAVATMSGAVATGVSVGTTSVSATLGSMSASTTLTVGPAALLTIDVTPESTAIANGTTHVFTATGSYSDATTRDVTTQVAWSSSATTVATISSEGVAMAVDAGTTTITATLGSVSSATPLMVTTATLTELDVIPVDPTVANGTVLPFAVTGVFSDGTTQDLTSAVTWTSSDPTIATVSNSLGTKGVVTTVAAGNTTITATYGAQSDTSDLTVTNAVLASISVTPSSSIAKGTWQQFSARGTYSDGTTQDLTPQVTWTSSNTAVATISNAVGSQGLVVGGAAGASTIQAQLSTISGSTTLTVTPAVLVSLAITPTSLKVARTYRVQFTAIGTFNDATTQNLTAQVTWSSSNTGVATISNAASSNGLAMAVAVGTTTIKATVLGHSAMTVLTGTNATLGSIVVTPAGSTLVIGSSRQMTATGTFSDGSMLDIATHVSWRSSKKKRVSVTKSGIATAVRDGLVTITAKKGNRNATASINVP